LVGIDPDYRLHVSQRLLGQNDGATLEALKRLNGGTSTRQVESRTIQIGTDLHCASSGSRQSREMSAIDRVP
jgi:hypothetical protein